MKRGWRLFFVMPWNWLAGRFLTLFSSIHKYHWIDYCWKVWCGEARQSEQQLCEEQGPSRPWAGLPLNRVPLWGQPELAAGRTETLIMGRRPVKAFLSVSTCRASCFSPGSLALGESFSVDANVILWKQGSLWSCHRSSERVSFKLPSLAQTLGKTVCFILAGIRITQWILVLGLRRSLSLILPL